MNRKHYNQLSKLISTLKLGTSERHKLVLGLANILMEENPRFDLALWVAGCTAQPAKPATLESFDPLLPFSNPITKKAS